MIGCQNTASFLAGAFAEGYRRVLEWDTAGPIDGHQAVPAGPIDPMLIPGRGLTSTARSSLFRPAVTGSIGPERRSRAEGSPE